MRGTFVYVSLKLNQDEIAAKYCVNKNITMCYGNCYIEKQLKSIEKETESNPQKGNSAKISFIDIIHKNTTVFEFHSQVWESEVKRFYTYSNSTAQEYISAILHPPQFHTI